MKTNTVKKTTTKSTTKPKRLSKAGIFLQTWTKGEIVDMRAVLK